MDANYLPGEKEFLESLVDVDPSEYLNTTGEVYEIHDKPTLLVRELYSSDELFDAADVVSTQARWTGKKRVREREAEQRRARRAKLARE